MQQKPSHFWRECFSLVPSDNVADGASALGSFVSEGDNHPHFKYAFDKKASENRKELATFLKDQGVSDYKNEANKVVKEVQSQKN
jgi:hypothetical protein